MTPGTCPCSPPRPRRPPRVRARWNRRASRIVLLQKKRGRGASDGGAPGSPCCWGYQASWFWASCGGARPQDRPPHVLGCPRLSPLSRIPSARNWRAHRLRAKLLSAPDLRGHPSPRPSLERRSERPPPCPNLRSLAHLSPPRRASPVVSGSAARVRRGPPRSPRPRPLPARRVWPRPIAPTVSRIGSAPASFSSRQAPP